MSAVVKLEFDFKGGKIYIHIYTCALKHIWFFIKKKQKTYIVLDIIKKQR